MSTSERDNSAAPAAQSGKRGGHGLRLMRNVTIGTKMWVAVGAMVAPLLTLMALFVNSQLKEISFVSGEVDGLAYYHPLEEIGGAINVRSALLAEGIASGRSVDLAGAEADVAREMNHMDELDQEYGRPGSQARWKSVREHWDQLRRQSFSDVESSVAAHEALNAEIADLRGYIATEWGMALDPMAETYYALDIAVNKIPEIENSIGTVRALLAAAATGNGATPGMKERMIHFGALIDDRLAGVRSGFAVIEEKVAGDPVARANFSRIDNSWADAVAAWQAHVDEVSADPNAVVADFAPLVAEGASAPVELDAAHDAVMEAVTALMQERKAAAIQHMIIGLSLVLLLCAAAIFLSHQVSWRIIGAIKRLREITVKVATGDFTNFIDVSGNDEVAQLFSAINQMQTQLSDDFERRKAYTAEIRRMSGGLAATSANVMIADDKNNIIYLNDAAKKMFGDIETELRRDLPAFSVKSLIGQNVDVFHKNPAHQQNLLRNLSGSHQARFVAGGKHISFTASPVFGDAGERLGTVVEWVDRTDAVEAEKEINETVDAFLAGDLSKRIKEQGKTGFYELIAKKMNIVVSGMAEIATDVQGIVADASRGDLSTRVQTQGKAGLAAKLGGDVNELVDAIGTVVDEVQKLVVAANDGDLTRRIDTSGKSGLLAKIGGGINELTANMADIVSQVKVAAGEVHRGAEEISQGNTNLSQRTEEQASSLEETASSMEEMTSTVKQNAENAGQANQLAVAARDQAEKGGSVVAKAVKAMSEINDASKKIADIIGVIDEIAFQTNLLALNAAVEAARAGEQGRGFAVVATEVRNLAGRSATAAKEIKALIQDSVHKVGEGQELVTQSGNTLEQIVGAVKKVTDIVAEIAAASAEQSSGIDQVNKAVMQLDELTQQNAALVEQASAASQSMAEQARGLNDSMAKYRVQDGQMAQALLERPVSRAPAPAPVRKAAAPRASAPAPRPKVAAGGGGADDAVWKEF